MRTLITLCVAGIFVVASCNDKKTSASQNDETQSISEYASFGEEIDDQDAVDLKYLTNILDDSDSVEVKLTAKIDEVCQMKGCWMTIENEFGDPVRITFKDYGFFVPKDIAGKTAIVKGQVKKVTLTKEDAKHYAEDAGKPFDSTKTYTELAFVADGVLIENNQE